jgi:hypothetical protein
MGDLRDFIKYEFSPFKLRIGDLEATNYYIGDDGTIKSIWDSDTSPKFSYFQISRLIQNIYYKKESDYNLVGDFYQLKNEDIYNINKSCFLNSESSFLIAKWNNIESDELNPNLEFILDRIFTLSDNDINIFMKIAKTTNDEIKRQLKLNRITHD